jgi:hypothetical protein
VFFNYCLDTGTIWMSIPARLVNIEVSESLLDVSYLLGVQVNRGLLE